MNPILINNSRIPALLSHFSAIEIWAITLWPFIFCRGQMSQRDIRHETIHFRQTEELFVVGFYLVYLWDWCWGLIKYRNDISGLNPFQAPYLSVSEKAYFRTRAEQEAYDNDFSGDYLKKRVRYKWLQGYEV